MRQKGAPHLSVYTRNYGSSDVFRQKKDSACILNAYTVCPGGAKTKILLVCKSVRDFGCNGPAQMSEEFMFGCGKVIVDTA